MSIDTSSDENSRWPGHPPWVRMRPRKHEPEPLLGPPEVNYPDSDGRLRSENTLQAEWIDLIQGNLTALVHADPNVFVASGLLWYPVEGRNTRRLGPHVMVVFGRPKASRGHYRQAQEGGIAPQVVFEVWAPGNRRHVMDYKFNFHERHGVEEYYLFNPHDVQIDGWLRDGEILAPIVDISGWVSPRLGIRFELDGDLTIFDTAGRPFLSHVENIRRRDQAERVFARMETDRADREHRRAERLAAQLRALGMEPEQ